MYKNSEQYSDPTAGLALAHIAYQECQKRKQAVWVKISLIYNQSSSSASSSQRLLPRKEASPSRVLITTVPETGLNLLDTNTGVNE